MTARRLPMFPLGTVLFPGALLPLHVFEPRYRTLVHDCLAGDRRFGVVLIARGSEVGDGEVLRVAVGTEAGIEAAQPFDDGRWGLLARGQARFEVVAWLPDAPYPMATVVDLHDEPGSAAGALDAAVAAVTRARTLASELGRPVDTAGALGEGAGGDTMSEADRLWRLCAASPLGPFDRQRLLEVPTLPARAALLTELASALADDLAALL